MVSDDESIFASGCLRGLVCGGPGRLAVIILLDISTINSTDFFDKILRGQMGEGGGEGKRNLEDWKMMLSTICCVCCGAICCV